MTETCPAKILSHTFSTINDDAVAEVSYISSDNVYWLISIGFKAMFRRAVSTIEGYNFVSLYMFSSTHSEHTE